MVNYLISHRWAWGPTEEFGIHTIVVQTPVTNQLDVATGCRDNFLAAFGAPGATTGLFSGQATYNRVSAARIINLSTGELAAASHATASLTMTGAAAAPPQLSVGYSLNAGTRPNGTPLRGRMYMPPPSTGSLLSPGTLQSTAQTTHATFLGTWLGNLRESGFDPSVWSRTLATVQSVSAARVGSVIDTIRSRRNQMPEVYVAAAIA